MSTRRLLPAVLCAVATVLLVGCGGREVRGLRTPAEAGLNTNNLIDPPAQSDADTNGNPTEWFVMAEKLRKPVPEVPLAQRKSILCLSGGGSYGAFTAGAVCGWTAAGDRPGTNGRPNFDVVTGISTGALVAPLVFLGPDYDPQVKEFYTSIKKRDIFRLRPVRGLLSLALADTGPLQRLIEETITPDLVAKLAAEHRAGRRLYVGTTELEGRRFVSWDIGEIACRGCPADRTLIQQILLGSSAIPGFFPPARIPVTVDGKPHYELHGDGGTSQSIFFTPPHTPAGGPSELAGTDLYMILAGKIYADAQPLKKRSLSLAGTSVSTVLYSQARGDLQRLYLVSLATGMNYHLCSIPGDFPAPTSSSAFDPEEMGKMFDEGYRIAVSRDMWRKSPPGANPGESGLRRTGTVLTHSIRGPGLVVPRKGEPMFPHADGRLPVPVTPDSLVK